jgi:hypothetical protein
VSERKNAMALTGAFNALRTCTVWGDTLLRLFSVRSQRTWCRIEMALAATTMPRASRAISAAPAP